MLGIEATDVVAECPGGEFAVGQQVLAMMGGMGRTFDGGYAHYACVPDDPHPGPHFVGGGWRQRSSPGSKT